MKIGLLGAGAYGLALSSILKDNNCDITIWTKHEKTKELLINDRVNKKYLPEYKLSDDILITTSLEEAISNKDLIIVAIPAAFIDSLAKKMASFVKDDHILIATKGIEQGTGLFINQIFEKYLDTKNIAVISGPTFAVDLITKMPAGLTVSSLSNETIKRSKSALQNSYIKLRENKDLIGTEICGSIKNVIAIAAGMLEGLNANESTKAMLLTEAILDMQKILDVFNAEKNTVLTYAGIGDLLLTCNSVKSRNYSFGKLLGQKVSKKAINNYLDNTTVEGYYTLKSIYELLVNKNISIPVIDLIYDIAVNLEDPEKLLTFLVKKD